MRRKLVVGALVAIGAALLPASLGSGASTQALSCGSGVLGAVSVGPVCTGVGVVDGIVCGSSNPVNPGTIGFVTINIDSAPAAVCAF